MPLITERGGVKFDEKEPSNFKHIVSFDMKLNSVGHDQLKSLRDVKEAMAMDAKAHGATYIANFTYGQRNGSVMQQIWSLDNVLWYGMGDAGIIEE